MILLIFICAFGTVSTLVIVYLFFKKKVFADLLQVVVGEEEEKIKAEMNEFSLSLNLNLNFDNKPVKQP